MDDRVRAKIVDLVTSGVRRLPEIKRHVRWFVEKDLFCGQDCPPMSDARYWPASHTVLNCVYRTTQILR